jgi:mannose-6-phosphate isomerase class I
MSKTLLYPLRFEPIYQYRLWGGRRLADLLTAPLPDEGPFGEAWVLSDRKDRQSRVTDGPLKGRTIAQLLEQSPEQLLGEGPQPFDRFPLLLKFLDAREMLSVQVHPSDAHTELLPAGETGKTEAWVVLEAGKESRIYAGLKPMALDDLKPNQVGLFNFHHRLATPVSPWERLKIGGGTPPILTRHGWLILYHGVSKIAEAAKSSLF